MPSGGGVLLNLAFSLLRGLLSTGESSQLPLGGTATNAVSIVRERVGRRTVIDK